MAALLRLIINMAGRERRIGRSLNLFHPSTRGREPSLAPSQGARENVAGHDGFTRSGNE
jgi:hypothetical protein